jgi:hypothetical protein
MVKVLCQHGRESSDSWQAGLLLASQEEVCPMELDNYCNSFFFVVLRIKFDIFRVQ